MTDQQQSTPDATVEWFHQFQRCLVSTAQAIADAYGPTNALAALLRGDDDTARRYLEAVSTARLRDVGDAADRLGGLADEVRYERGRAQHAAEVAARRAAAEETPA